MRATHRRRTRLKGERGYVLIMSALLMLPLLAFAGFAVDIGYWYTHANRMQRAADAAALAGVVWMPNDEKAETIALETAKANGYDDAAANIEVRVTPVGNRRLQVYIHDTDVDMFLSSIFIDQVDIERQALAEYVQAIPMGSPDNTLGNDPDRWNITGYSRPYYWLNTSGPDGRKANGDRHTAGVCDAYSGCSGTTNLEYSDDGYFYRLNVDARPVSGDLLLQVYDPAFFYTGDVCDANSNLLDPRGLQLRDPDQHPRRSRHDRRRPTVRAGQHRLLRGRPGHQRGGRRDLLHRAGAGQHAVRQPRQPGPLREDVQCLQQRRVSPAHQHRARRGGRTCGSGTTSGSGRRCAPCRGRA